jgi:hypothetical protein
LKQHIFNEHQVMCIGRGFVFVTNNGGNYQWKTSYKEEDKYTSFSNYKILATTNLILNLI